MKNIIELEGHRLANYFPAIQGTEFNDLVESIRKNGQINPIILFEGKILDGKNRYRACQELGIEPITEEYSGSDPLDFVIAENINRRHLTESQRALLATEMLPEFEKQAREHYNKIKSKQVKDQKTANGKFVKSVKPFKKVRTEDKFDSANEAGKQFGVSGSSVQKAKRIKKAVDDGELDKGIIDDIHKGKKTLGAADKELHDKRFAKGEKEKETKRNKKLPNEYPKAVSEYIHDVKEFKNILSTATILAKEGMFSPEAIQFIHRIHEQIKSLMKEMEVGKNE
jgi:ParB-like chromosome segregation protein Spo0J